MAEISDSRLDNQHDPVCVIARCTNAPDPHAGYYCSEHLPKPYRACQDCTRLAVWPDGRCDFHTTSPKAEPPKVTQDDLRSEAVVRHMRALAEEGSGQPYVVRKRAFDLLDTIDHLRGQIVAMRQVVTAAEVVRAGVRYGYAPEIGQLAIIEALDEYHEALSRSAEEATP